MGTQRGVNGWLAIHKLTCVFLSPFAMCDDHGVPLYAYSFSFWKRKRFGTMRPRHWDRSTGLCFPYYIA